MLYELANVLFGGFAGFLNYMFVKLSRQIYFINVYKLVLIYWLLGLAAIV